MRWMQAAGAFGLALTLAGGFPATGVAQQPVQTEKIAPAPEPLDVPDGQTPPAEPQPSAQTPPEKPKCITDTSGFRTIGNGGAYVIELTNTCERRLRCTVSAYVLTSQGPAQGRATLTLGPKSKGEAAHKSYVIKIKSAGGMANSSHECKAL